MTLPKEFRKGFIAQVVDIISDFYRDTTELFTADYRSMSRWIYSDLMGTLEASFDENYSNQFKDMTPEVKMACILTQEENDDWAERTWTEYAAELKRELPMEALSREIDMAPVNLEPSIIIDPIAYVPQTSEAKVDEYEDITHLFDEFVIEEDKGYTEEELVAAIKLAEDEELDLAILGQYKSAVSDLVGGFEDADPIYSIKALGISSVMDSTSIDSVEDAFLKLTDLKEEYAIEKRDAMISYTDVLERANRLQATLDSGLTGKKISVKIRYGRKMESIYQRLDDSMSAEDGQLRLAQIVPDLDALESRINSSASRKMKSVAARGKAALEYSVAKQKDTAEVRDELFHGSKQLESLSESVGKEGFGERDIGNYMAAIFSFDSLTSDVMPDSVYIPPPIRVVQPQL